MITPSEIVYVLFISYIIHLKLKLNHDKVKVIIILHRRCIVLKIEKKDPNLIDHSINLGLIINFITHHVLRSDAVVRVVLM